MRRKSLLIVMAACTLLAASCKKDDNNPGKPALNIPSAYDSTNYKNNIAAEVSLKNQVSALSTYIKTAEDGTTTLDLGTLNDKFANGGTPTLKSITGAYYVTRIENDWFPVIVASSGNTYDPANGATAQKGGAYNNRLLDKGAKENLQEIDKGFYAAALYNHMVTLTQGTVTTATVDQMISIIGANPSFPNTSTAGKAPAPDALLASYAARRDKNDGTGLYTQLKTNFIKLQAAVKAGADYNKERDEAIAAIKTTLEKALVATTINYGYAAITKLSSTNPTPATIAGGLHDLGEAIGFIHGLKAVPQQHRKITDAQVDEILALFNAPTNGDATMYMFVTDGATELQKISQAQQKIKAVYGFTDAEMEDFKQNWVSAQGR